MEAEVFSTIVRNYATALALLAGAGVAIWKWGFEERLRKRREIASPDGFLSSTTIPLGSDKVIVTLEAKWGNRGRFSIYLDEHNSYVSAIQIEETERSGTLLKERNEEFVKAPLFHGPYIMEPNTESVMHQHFIMPRSGVFLFRWVIALNQKHSSDFGGDGIFICSREIVIDTTLANQTTEPNV